MIDELHGTGIDGSLGDALLIIAGMVVGAGVLAIWRLCRTFSDPLADLETGRWMR